MVETTVRSRRGRKHHAKPPKPRAIVLRQRVCAHRVSRKIGGIVMLTKKQADAD
jgi:hypothetical protein